MVNVTLNGRGAQQFAQVSQRLVTLTGAQNQFGIVLDGRVVSAPGIQSAITNGRAEIAREMQSPFAAIAQDEFQQTRFVDGDLVGVQDLDLARIFIDADHLVAALGKAGGGDESHVSGANDSDFHDDRSSKGKRSLYQAIVVLSRWNR